MKTFNMEDSLMNNPKKFIFGLTAGLIALISVCALLFWAFKCLG